MNIILDHSYIPLRASLQYGNNVWYITYTLYHNTLTILSACGGFLSSWKSVARRALQPFFLSSWLMQV